MIEKLPLWATNDDYATGPDTGTPTKVDPASQADGFIAGVVAAPQHVNFLVDLGNQSLRRTLALAILRLRELRRDGVTITDTAASMGAAQNDAAAFCVVMKTAQSFGVTDWDLLNTFGIPPTLTSLVTGMEFRSSLRVQAIGTGGTNNVTSADGGGTWLAGQALGVAGAGTRIILKDVNNFAVCGPSDVNVYTGQGGQFGAWTAANSGHAAPVGLASLAGNTIVVGGTPPLFTTSASAFASTGGTIQNSGDADGPGDLAGSFKLGAAKIYHAASMDSGDTIQVSSSADGATWTTLASLPKPPDALSSTAFSSDPRILMCQVTGLLVIVAPFATDTQCALYASLDGIDWLGPVIIANPGVDAFALAGGRLLATFGAQLFSSDGLGSI